MYSDDCGVFFSPGGRGERAGREGGKRGRARRAGEEGGTRGREGRAVGDGEMVALPARVCLCGACA